MIDLGNHTAFIYICDDTIALERPQWLFNCQIYKTSAGKFHEEKIDT